MKFDKKFTAKLKGLFGKYEFEVGILNDSAYKVPKRGVRGQKGQDVLSRYAGGPIRKKSTVDSGMTIGGVVKENMQRLNINFLAEPFKNKSSDIIKFSNAFFKLVFGQSQQRRCENLLQAIVRNPILRGEYGSNSALTQKIKGFNRGMIDTAQMFKAIKAVTRVKSRV